MDLNRSGLDLCVLAIEPTLAPVPFWLREAVIRSMRWQTIGAVAPFELVRRALPSGQTVLLLPLGHRVRRITIGPGRGGQ
jgi:hypothetical protein